MGVWTRGSTVEDIWSALNFIGRGFRELVASRLERLVEEPGYGAGFLDGILALVVLVLVGGALNYAWARVLKFFSSTKAPPAPAVGPAPAELTGGCAQGAVLLIVLVAVIAFLLSRLLLP